MSRVLKGLTAGAADPDPVAFEHAFDIDHVIDPVCRFRRRLRIRTRGRWRHRPRSRSRIRKGPLWRQLSGAQSLRTIDVFEGSWGSLGSPGGISGVLGGSRGGSMGGSRRSLGFSGAVGGSLGAPQGVSGGLLKMSIFILLGGEFAYGLEWNGLFRNWSTSRRWGVGIVLCNFLFVFRSLLFGKLWGEYGMKTDCFLTIPILTSWDFNEQMMPKTWFRQVKFEVQVDRVLGKSVSFFNSFTFWEMHRNWMCSRM